MAVSRPFGPWPQVAIAQDAHAEMPAVFDWLFLLQIFVTGDASRLWQAGYSEFEAVDSQIRGGR